MPKATTISETIELGHTPRGMLRLNFITLKINGRVVSRVYADFAKDGYVTTEPYSDLNVSVLTSEPARVTAKHMEYQHGEAFGREEQRTMYVDAAMRKYGHMIQREGNK